MNRKGSVLIISLWILAIIVVFALGLGHRASVALRLSRYQKDSLSAASLARAGILRAVAELEKDTNFYDGLEEPWSTGINPDTKRNEFFEIELSENSGNTFTVQYLYDKEKGTYLCMEDQERLININAAPQELLLSLFEYYNVEPGDAEGLTKYIRIFRGENVPGVETGSEVFKSFKKRLFSNPEELITVFEFYYKDKGETGYLERARGLFNTIKGAVTAVGDSLNSGININTVSEGTLLIFARSLAEDEGQMSAATNVVSQIMQMREAKEEKCFKDLNEISLPIAAGSAEELLFNNLKAKFKIRSGYFRINSFGSSGRTTKNICAIYNRQDRVFACWREN